MEKMMIKHKVVSMFEITNRVTIQVNPQPQFNSEPLSGATAGKAKRYGVFGGAFHGAKVGGKMAYDATKAMLNYAKEIARQIPIIGWLIALVIVIISPVVLIVGTLLGVPIGFVGGAITGPFRKRPIKNE